MSASGSRFRESSEHSFRAASEMHFLCHEICAIERWSVGNRIQFAHSIGADF